MRWPFSALHELCHRPSQQLPTLDGLRAIAVLLVICDHWVYEWVDIAHLPAPSFVRLPLFYWGWTGVDLFFVLSGFLIGRQLWSELDRTGRIDVWQFVLRRGLRIWPLYYVVLIGLALIRDARAPQWPDWIMLSNYVPTRYARSWSLSTEEQFYLLMPVTLLAIRKFVAARWWPYCVLALLIPVCASRAYTLAELSAHSLTPQRISDLMYSAFHLHCESLLIGTMVAWITLWKPELLSPAASSRFAARVFLGAGAVAIFGIALRTLNREVFAYLALGCVYGAALCIALADTSPATEALRWRIWYPIARLSFGMYLNHLILREPTDTIIRVMSQAFRASSREAFLAGLILTVLASAGMAAITFVCVEQPCLTLRDRWLAHRKQRQFVAAPTAS